MTNKEACEAYAQYYLASFRSDVTYYEERLARARERLAIAEREHAAGQMVTGEPDGMPVILRGILTR